MCVYPSKTLETGKREIVPRDVCVLHCWSVLLCGPPTLPGLQWGACIPMGLKCGQTLKGGDLLHQEGFASYLQGTLPPTNVSVRVWHGCNVQHQDGGGSSFTPGYRHQMGAESQRPSPRVEGFVHDRKRFVPKTPSLQRIGTRIGKRERSPFISLLPPCVCSPS